jgi:hypothetical protein
VENAEQVQQDYDKDRHAGEPEDDVAEHGQLLQAVGVVMRRRWSPNSNLAGIELSR